MDIKKWMEKLNLKGRQLKITYWLLVLALLGIGIMVISQMIYPTPSTEEAIDEHSQEIVQEVASQGQDIIRIEQEWEGQLQRTLGTIEGVGDVVVKISMDTSEQTHYATNDVYEVRTTEEKDTQGGTRKITERKESTNLILLHNNAQPIPVKTTGVKIKGILVVAEGAKNSYVKASLVRAVQTVTDLPAHKITIIAKEVN